MHRVYSYVGPPEVARGIARSSEGRRIGSPHDLTLAGHARRITCTYVVDIDGVLRIAPRESEHVACAGGRPVLAAGEIEIEGGLVRSATNLSTGFCPAPTCWKALARALDRAGIQPPRGFDPAFEMRRCDRCRARNVIKDEVFECAECEAALDREWNFDSNDWHRGSIELDAIALVVDTVIAPAERDEDRVSVRSSEETILLALSDGAGGTGRGRGAATAVVGATASDVRAIEALDASLAARASGEATAVLVSLRSRGELFDVSGASVGDSRAWARRRGEWIEVTEDQRRKPLVGSGRAAPVAFALDLVDTLVITSDGIASYLDERRLLALIDEASDTIGRSLVDAVRLETGSLRDDASAIVVRAQRFTP